MRQCRKFRRAASETRTACQERASKGRSCTRPRWDRLTCRLVRDKGTDRVEQKELREPWRAPILATASRQADTETVAVTAREFRLAGSGRSRLRIRARKSLKPTRALRQLRSRSPISQIRFTRMRPAI